MTARPRSAHRELTDFLVLALAFVFLVRTFVGEPFGVPTGSMAPTLLGAHKLIHCPECDKTFPVGSDENSGEAVVCLCPACGTKLDIAAAPVTAGSRIVVMKGPPTPLKRWDVAVFKFVDEPRKFYVKRIIGLPGEHLRIRGGEIELWNEGEQRWQIARKPAALAKDVAIPVWEEEHQKADAEENWRPRTESGWEKIDGGWRTDGESSLSFQCLLPDGRPRLVGDELGYNFGLPRSQADNADVYWNRASNPVGDLHVEFVLQGESELPKVVVEIRRGGGLYRLELRSDGGRFLRNEHVVEQWSDVRLGAKAKIRFAFVDRRLLFWADDKLVREWKEPEVEWPSDWTPKDWISKDDLTPIKISGGPAQITGLRVYRDLYYTQQIGATDFLPTEAGRDMMGEIKEFKRFREARRRATEFTVPPGCYFALGDNSDRSLDGRHWKHSHFIEERTIVGKVLFKLGR